MTKAKNRKKTHPIKNKSTTTFWKNKTLLTVLFIILVLTTITLFPSLQNDFVNWDDDKNFYENPLVVNSFNFTSLLKNIPAIFSTPVIGNYNPLSNFTFAVENVIFGLENPFYWHLDNLLLHLFCVALIFRISLALGLNIWASALCALLFGIHPMRVESVAWVTERKDVLFGSFYLLALYYYIKGVKNQKPNQYIKRIIILFILSGLAKIQAVSLPLSMLAIDYYFKREISTKRIIEKWFYFVISIGIGILGILFLQQQGSLEATTDFGYFDRLFIGSYSYIMYNIKLLVPYELVPMYPYPPSLSLIFYLSMIPALAMVAFFFYSYKKEWRILVFGIFFFTVNIVFLLQIVGAGQGFVADRFTYIAYFGLFFILAFYFQKLFDNKKYRFAVSSIVAIVLLAFSYISFNQTKIWKNSGTLWTHVIQYYPNTTLPWGNRANFNRDSGNIKQALVDYNKAISLGATKSGPYNSRAKLFFRSNNRDSILLALQDYNTAISLEPDKGEYYMNRGATYARLQDFNKALADLVQAGNLEPDNQTVYLNRSIVYHQMRQYQNEINDINVYLSYNARNGNMWANRANAYMLLRQWDKGLQDINQAIQLNPNAGVYYFYRAQYYYNTNQAATAQQDLNKARQLGFAFNGTIEDLRMKN